MIEPDFTEGIREAHRRAFGNPEEPDDWSPSDFKPPLEGVNRILYDAAVRSADAQGAFTLVEGEESGKQTFETGAQRDTQEGKPRYTLISPKFKRRLAEALTRGAEHYGSHNWHKGIPVERSLDSLLRHLEHFIDGDTDEDHLANAACNLMFIMEFEGTELDDRYDWGKNELDH